ncbi:hypothetical protein CDAR_387631 [Caerostris darwini]|uniref:Uncharacterized protein n=1 Tax=Caerostris darwini TaxID=1538125 RepID=A0AAV4TM42_9ARAC|nr:hypothetical protein CDAR_387631 [Caerostris darwini]
MERRSHLTPELSSVHWGWGAVAFDTEDGFRTVVSGLRCERAEGGKKVRGCMILGRGVGGNQRISSALLYSSLPLGDAATELQINQERKLA